ncbi:MAG TPA: hypothetical protein VEU31_04130 [Candidatus Acidoferrales bacterium]|nr:hypothetical protein [Candidatus Acidoferrales bacterium]
MPEEQKSGFPIAFLAGGVIVALLVGAVFLYTQHSGGPRTAAPPPLPMGAAEQAYAPRIRFTQFRAMRAANFLHQEVTFLFGNVTNDGNRAIREIQVQLEFRDVFNQVVLRDTVRVLGRSAAPLAPEESRDIQLTYEHIAADWNQASPALRITGLLFQ